MTTRLSIALIAALIVPAGAAPAAGATAPIPACTAADLAGTRAPFEVEEAGPEGGSAPVLRAGKAYRFVVVQEQVIRDGTPQTRLLEDSASVIGRNGLTVTKGFDREAGRQIFSFTPRRAGTARFDASWVVTTDPSGASQRNCLATRSYALPVRTPQLVGTRARFIDRSMWLLGLVPPATRGLDEKDARDLRPVTVLIRVRKGTLRPPLPRGAATYRISYRYDEDARFLTTRSMGPGYIASLFTNFDWDGAGVEITSNPNVPRSGVRFAFSIEVRQAGRVIGGMRSGAFCRSERFRRDDGAIRTRSRCARPNFAGRP